jgi:hypothetical protein
MIAATMVFPDPTSHWSNLIIGFPLWSDSIFSLITFFCAVVSSKGSEAMKSLMISKSGIPCHSGLDPESHQIEFPACAGMTED